jgi:transcriptional regulator with XRE-family HTH domain
MALGEELRRARTRKKISASEVAAATRMKVQIVEALEQEDFSKVAAPIYAKGFIRLYAEHVGLDPSPLISEYMSKFVVQEEPSLIVDHYSSEPNEEIEAVEEVEEDGEQRPQTELNLFTETQSAEEPEPAEEPEAQKPGVSAIESTVRQTKEQLVRWSSVISNVVRTRLQLAGGLLREQKARLEKKELPKIPWKSFPVMLGVFLVVVILLVSGISKCVRRKPEPPASPVAEKDMTPEPLRLAVEPPDPYID